MSSESATPATDLTGAELVDLVHRVFAPRPGEHNLAILADLPDQHTADHAEWQDRRRLAAHWHDQLAKSTLDGGLTCRLFAYRNARANNADLPAGAWQINDKVSAEAVISGGAAQWDAATQQSFDHIFSQYPIVIALTEFSATAPLKLMSAQLGFRAATMPGFGRSMIEALRLDYTEVDRRVRRLAKRLDDATEARFAFRVDDDIYHLSLDLRHRRAHASGGLVQNPGQAGNLPSGETYIVPYEGEIDGDPSRSNGVLPVQLGDEVILYRISENRATEVLSQGPQSSSERQYLLDEPAYGNLAELGLGVLADFGIQPVGQILLDEKLGLHIAFGRSDHFGGQVGASQFSRPEAVVHIDRVYLPETQDRIHVESVDLATPKGDDPLMRHGKYV